MESQQVPVQVYLPRDLHTRLKVIAVTSGRKLSDVIIDSLRKELGDAKNEKSS